MKYLTSILLVMALIIVSGCTGQNQENLDYMTGSEGIEVSFVDDGLNEIYEASAYTLSAEIKNKGVFDEPYGKVVLRGFDPTIMPFENMADGLVVEGIPRIDPVSMYNLEGGFELIDFKVPKNEIYIPYGESYNPSLVASSCYYYETVAAPTVCIVPDLMTYQKQKFCSTDTIYMQSQGAPVAVTKVDENIMENFVNFVITIENIGGGKVLKRDQKVYNNCPNAIKYEDLNEVQFDLNIPGMPAPKCMPEGKVKLVNGKGTFTCKFQITPEYGSKYSLEYDKDSFTKQMKIMLQYFYTKDIYKDLNVLRIPGREGESIGIVNTPVGNDNPKQPPVPPKAPEANPAAELTCSCAAHDDDGIARPATTRPNAETCICLYHKTSEGNYDNVYCGRQNSPDKVFPGRMAELVIVPSDKEHIKDCKFGDSPVDCMKEMSHVIPNGKITIAGFYKDATGEKPKLSPSQECYLTIKE